MQQIRDDKFYEDAGFNAYRLGLNSFDAPYKHGDARLKLWLAGYTRAKNQHTKPLEVSDKNRPKSCARVASSSPFRRPAPRMLNRKSAMRRSA